MDINNEFKKNFGDIKVIEREEEKEIYSHDIGEVPQILEGLLFNTMPYFIVQPKNIEEIKKVFRFANEKNISVIPRGAASWGFGGVIPTKSGIVVDMSPLRKIIELNKKDKTITVESGARWSDIDITAKKDGLCLMTYPSSKFSTVGGWISTGGYGINSFRYGHISKQIVSMKVVTPIGEVKTITPEDPEFKYFISTEGLFGIIFEVTLKLRETPKESHPHILYFESDETAFKFIENLIKIKIASNEIEPNVIRFLDKTHLIDTNEIMHAKIFEEKPAVLIELDNHEGEQRFLEFISQSQNNNTVKEAPHYVANYLWNERLFGMKIKRLGPTILASEVIIPINKTAGFIKKAKKIGKNFGVEIGVDSYIINQENALVMLTFLCDSRKLKYFVDLPLALIITKAGVSMDAKPYGLGIWNSPFIKNLFTEEEIRELKEYKKKIDPANILNRGKFFSVKSKWFNIPSTAFNPMFFNTGIYVMIMLSPLIGKIASFVFGRHEKIDKLEIELSTHACAKCGSCIAVCPAYLVTKNEGVTAKGKVALAKKNFRWKNYNKRRG